MKKVIIIGANGFIGKELVKRMKDRKMMEEIKIYTSDIQGESDYSTKGKTVKDIYEFITENEIDVVINLAAISSDRRCEERRTEVEELNILFPKNLYRYLKNSSKQTLFIQASTEWIYGDNVVVREIKYPNQLSENGLGAYALSKLICERELIEQASTNNRLILARLGIIYALGNSICNSFINKVTESEEEGKEFICKSGKSARRYVSIEQVCDTIASSIHRKCKKNVEIMDIQGERLYRNEEVLKMIKRYRSDFIYKVEDNYDNSETIRDVFTCGDEREQKYSLEEQLKSYYG